MAKRDYYDILGCSKSSSETEIKKAYRTKAKELHPDRNSDKKNAEEDFKLVNEAYEVLKDPNKKAAYDRYGHAAFEGGGGGFGQGAGQGDFSSAFSDVFEDLFGDFMGGGNRRGSQRATRGSDLRYNMRVNLEESYTGKKASINLPSSVSCDVCSGSGAEGGAEPLNCPTCAGHGKVRAQQGFFTVERTCPTCTGKGQIIKNPCKTCSGQGRVEKQRSLNVTIPAGVETGQRVRLSGEGEAGLQNGPPGDLYIFIEVGEHQLFDREGVNLFCKIPISMTTAALGGEIEAPTVDGGRCKVKVPQGVQSGKQLRLKGKGMPSVRGSGFGDLYIDLTVETPVNLSSEQKDLLRQFDKSGQNNHPAGKDFISIVKNFWDKAKK
ncbi:MAG: molecular chaperone DnaJ [Pseudomonadota bacterium]|nr:molecular chaperone DnaJ [Pseudomonadota bacterium]